MNKLLKASAMALSLMVTTISVGTAMPSRTEAAISSTTGSRIVTTAKSYIGDVDYRFGTRDASRLIFDCSSFTQFILKKHGISVPWSSREQAKEGNWISKSKLRAGDLVFFSVGTPGRIDHVGIYVGNGKFISNTRSAGVVITSMTSGYWEDRYITGRRL
ncbi:C40 family peptidase [Paenibacillus mucilaginosus]|uniref:NLP/P60 family protein n=3 Tax=Paenibacillus mucilaginosus TaxID=61624 RepID=H6NEX1_9BACL|nr:C40 family peptidase [Paenibacillus mucilaginosus]AEI40000.1 NLP/P60 family protein [Paenibacillus mucilaginosus KNP414]AFC28662.1 NLP/P60 family protein [Paenibacillus mucilaginosus 3016]AFH60837.1 hydrolase Nlp/P60 [Paenibacillus mucilaginosus K02]MCG7216419.1 C40 family peptidase [Paenibacillus mucilaginosus]WDM29251.1 C40 family peptidase [Paenibacillus mucilaginosus]